MKTEEHKVSGRNLLDRVKQIVHEGNVRRITIKNAEGKSILEIPLTIGVVGVVLLPVWAAVAGLECGYEIGLREVLLGRVGVRVGGR